METEYIEKQAAVEIAMQYCPDDDGSCSRAGEDIRDLLDELEGIPPADVRPVVLCDKCRWFDDRGYPNPDPEMPELRMGHCRILGRDVQACWFCATGEREGGDAE